MTSEPFSPPETPEPAQRARPFLSFLLAVFLLLFLASGLVAALDHLLMLVWGLEEMAIPDALLSLLMLVASGLLFGMLAVFPAIPKRYFMPVALFVPLTSIAVLPLLVYFHQNLHLIAIVLACFQIVVALLVYFRIRKGQGWKLPLVPADQFTGRNFSWRHLAGVWLAGLLVLLPLALLYAAFSAKLAVSHFTDGFVSLHPSGLTMHVRTYTRDDGKTITLMPMSHVGEPDFYQELSESFPANAVVLMEGVSDKNKTINTHSNYSKMAGAVGGVEQTAAFKPPGEIVAADVDMSSFSPETLEILKTAMLIHAKGVTPETLPLIMKPTPPGLEKRLMEDVLTKRNKHLLGVIEERLPNSENIVVPWGAAHMPEIAREIQKLGFRLVGTREYTAIRFGG